MKKPIKQLQELATEIIGDGKSPELFFVTEEGIVTTVSRNFEVAYKAWKALDRTAESALESRKIGTLASVEPAEEGSSTLVRIDDAYQWFGKSHPEAFDYFLR